MANSKVKPAFNQQVVVLPIETIVPQKELSLEFRKSTTYKRISASLEHVGLIEPLVVYPRGPEITCCSTATLVWTFSSSAV